MRNMQLGTSNLDVPVVAVGCMRLTELDGGQAERFVNAALALGANFFDHADIYGGGKCEEIFAKAIHMSPAVRDKLILQSKCGIRNGSFDFSRAYIMESVEGILRRLCTDYLDVLLLHRPDALVEPEEVAEAFDALHASGKVRHFGVSNQNPMQMELLRRYVKQPLIANQLQLSIAHANMISNGLHVNMSTPEATGRDGGILDYCRLHDITVQPWSPFQYGFFEGVFLGNDKFEALNKKIGEVAARYGVSDTTIAVAWLLRHPARMQPVIGTMNEQRLADCCKAAEITLTREEWYAIFLAAGNILP
ncbi:MAG: aldo/keto reductase [Clostridia bacterium]|nr:aldo/keto reductase [Clostridia bacterium]